MAKAYFIYGFSSYGDYDDEYSDPSELIEIFDSEEKAIEFLKSVALDPDDVDDVECCVTSKEDIYDDYHSDYRYYCEIYDVE